MADDRRWVEPKPCGRDDATPAVASRNEQRRRWLHPANLSLHVDASGQCSPYNDPVIVETARPVPSALRLQRLWLIIPAACVVPAVLDALQTYMQGRLLGARYVSGAQVIFSGIEWLFLGALTPITYYLAKRFPIRRETLRRTVTIHIIGSLLLCVGWASAGVALRYVLGIVDAKHLAGNFASWVLTSIPWSVFMYFAMLGSMYAFVYFSEARQREAQAARLAAQLAESRLGALRMQLNPHFLFNSLNAIGVLVRDKNTTAASRMLELLGDVLHTVLRSEARHEVGLDEEVRFLEQYLAIEQVRFSDRLRVSWSIDADTRRALVPGFVLQPLVENALRHGIAKVADEGTIAIGARREGSTLVLTVSDNGPGLPTASTHGSGVGISNTRERLETMFGSAASLMIAPRAGGGVVATIRIPYREVADA
jgi:two-component system LytT family sensor kinase